MAGIGEIAKEAKLKSEDVALVIETIKNMLCKDIKVTIQDFGSFDVDVKDSGDARNVRTGEKVRVVEKSIPRFKFGQAFKKLIEEQVPVDVEKLQKKRKKKEEYYAKHANETKVAAPAPAPVPVQAKKKK